MSLGDWTDEENDLIVADYFAMLADDLAGRRYNKAEHNRQLQERIDRSRTSIEFKHQNISAVLKGLGESWIPGYKPAFNFQMVLVDAVARWLARNPAWMKRVPDRRSTVGRDETALFRSVAAGAPPDKGGRDPSGEFKVTDTENPPSGRPT